MSMISVNNLVAITPPKSDKIETKVEGGFAQATQKKEIVRCDLVMQFCVSGRDYVSPGKHKAIIAGERAFAPWAKKIHSIDGKEFVLCPIGEIIGFEAIKE